MGNSNGKPLFNELPMLRITITSDEFIFDRIKPLLDAVFSKKPNDKIWDQVYNTITKSNPPPRPIASSLQQRPCLRNTGSFVISLEHLNDVLKHELGVMYVDIRRFHDTFIGGMTELETASEPIFKKCTVGTSPLFLKGWTGWPEDSNEKIVLDDIRRGLQANLDTKTLSTTSQVDPGFDLRVQVGHRLPFDINEDGLRFVSTILGFLWMNEEELGFDPTVFVSGSEQYIEIERDSRKERLIIDEVMIRTCCIASRATTCWKAHLQGDPRASLVIKYSWQYTELDEEGDMLREATGNGIINVARYYHHHTRWHSE
ncbi:uncharacterized protein BCR38DRAFT_406842 [Pseudomassariella vexata]|uniref:Fungal-type protein kinase domain-containing protein n=1 Tax=Pseudomassariella vexata TaxID=1141098 RepID=A0A1Y2ECF2_9PEZI|nr:uncharacterized protein BCR38DRAFT_406842 [Pseudomassariella vexata]ORY68964.1 hypothetical protein BCR38DRAFT_406842 [Pseudomassariella vexata]